MNPDRTPGMNKGETMHGIATAFFAAFMCLPAAALAVPSGKTLTWPDGTQGTVAFEGKEHAEKGLKCDACHPGLFPMKKGAAKMTMEALNQGRFCGACHNGTAAFSTADPKKCHKCHKAESGKKHKEKHGESHGHHD